MKTTMFCKKPGKQIQILSEKIFFARTFYLNCLHIDLLHIQLEGYYRVNLRLQRRPKTAYIKRILFLPVG